jgi:hypothetical protein
LSHGRAWDRGVGSSHGCSSRFDRLVLVADDVSGLAVSSLSSAKCVTMYREAAGVFTQGLVICRTSRVGHGDCGWWLAAVLSLERLVWNKKGW